MRNQTPLRSYRPSELSYNGRAQTMTPDEGFRAKPLLFRPGHNLSFHPSNESELDILDFLNDCSQNSKRSDSSENMSPRYHPSSHRLAQPLLDCPYSRSRIQMLLGFPAMHHCSNQSASNSQRSESEDDMSSSREQSWRTTMGNLQESPRKQYRRNCQNSDPFTPPEGPSIIKLHPCFKVQRDYSSESIPRFLQDDIDYICPPFSPNTINNDLESQLQDRMALEDSLSEFSSVRYNEMTLEESNIMESEASESRVIEEGSVNYASPQSFSYQSMARKSTYYPPTIRQQGSDYESCSQSFTASENSPTISDRRNVSANANILDKGFEERLPTISVTTYLGKTHVVPSQAVLSATPVIFHADFNVPNNHDINLPNSRMRFGYRAKEDEIAEISFGDHINFYSPCQSPTKPRREEKLSSHDIQMRTFNGDDLDNSFEVLEGGKPDAENDDIVNDYVFLEKEKNNAECQEILAFIQ